MKTPESPKKFSEEQIQDFTNQLTKILDTHFPNDDTESYIEEIEEKLLGDHYLIYVHFSKEAEDVLKDNEAFIKDHCLLDGEFESSIDQ